MSQWYYSLEGKSQGPVRLEDLREKVLNGDLTPLSYVFLVGGSEWRPAQEYDELKSAFTERAEKQMLTLHETWILLKKNTKSDASSQYLHDGPYSTSELQKKLESGEITYYDHVWKKGQEKWQRIGDLEDFKVSQEIRIFTPTPDTEATLIVNENLRRESEAPVSPLKRDFEPVAEEPPEEARPTDLAATQEASEWSQLIAQVDSSHPQFAFEEEITQDIFVEKVGGADGEKALDDLSLNLDPTDISLSLPTHSLKAEPQEIQEKLLTQALEFSPHRQAKEGAIQESQPAELLDQQTSKEPDKTPPLKNKAKNLKILNWVERGLYVVLIAMVAFGGYHFGWKRWHRGMPPLESASAPVGSVETKTRELSSVKKQTQAKMKEIQSAIFGNEVIEEKPKIQKNDTNPSTPDSDLNEDIPVIKIDNRTTKADLPQGSDEKNENDSLALEKGFDLSKSHQGSLPVSKDNGSFIRAKITEKGKGAKTIVVSTDVAPGTLVKFQLSGRAGETLDENVFFFERKKATEGKNKDLSFALPKLPDGKFKILLTSGDLLTEIDFLSGDLKKIATQQNKRIKRNSRVIARDKRRLFMATQKFEDMVSEYEGLSLNKNGEVVSERIRAEREGIFSRLPDDQGKALESFAFPDLLLRLYHLDKRFESFIGRQTLVKGERRKKRGVASSEIATFKSVLKRLQVDLKNASNLKSL